MIPDPHRHRLMLTKEAYADDKAMRLRQEIHEQYSVPAFDLHSWVVERFAWRGDETLLDLGSGSGTYIDKLKQYIPTANYLGVDLSHGMLRAAGQHEQGVALALGDAESIPLAANSFDVVFANHMLYHVNDIDRAIQEIHRVVRPTGVLVAATNSHETMPEFRTLIQRAFRLMGLSTSGGEQGPEHPFLKRFSLETGTVKLARQFKAVVRYDIPSALVFTTPEPVVEYINSTRPFYEYTMPPDVIWDDFMVIMRDQVRRLINHFGELVVNKLSGVLIASDEGGFSAEYHQVLENYKSGKIG